MNFSRLLAIAIDASISIVGDISLGSGIKSLGDWVKSSAGAKGDSSGISIGIGVSSVVSISISRPLANVVTIVSSIGKGDPLGHSIKSLGDWVKTSAGAKRNSSRISIGIGVSGIVGISISRPLANVVSSISSIGKGNSLGHSIKSLCNGVQTSAGAKWDSSGISIGIGISSIVGISISRPLANVVTIVSSISSIGKSSSLGHRVKSLCDWVKTSAGAKGDSSSIGVVIAIGKVGGISVSVSSGSCHKASKEKCLDHVPN